VVLIDPALKKHLTFIQSFFDDYFNFHPRYIFKYRSSNPINCSILIYINATAENCEIKRNREITTANYLELGVKQGITQVEQFIYLIKNNLQVANAEPVKRSDKA